MPLREVAAALALAATSVAVAQPEWSPHFDFTGFTDPVNVLLAFDPDGPGPRPRRLFAAGEFLGVGEVKSRGLVAWTGDQWEAAADLPVKVHSAIARDLDGPGPAPARLLACGQLFGDPDGRNSVSIWDGDTVSQLGSVQGYLQPLEAWDADGPGPAAPLIITGGRFTGKDEKIHCIAFFDGAHWQQFAGGIQGGQYSFVWALTAWDPDGPGPSNDLLFAGGDFDAAGGQPIPFLAATDGATWTAPGGGVNGAVSSLTVFDEDGDGPGQPMLFVAGTFSEAGGLAIPYLARFDGQGWSAAGPSPDGPVYRLEVIDPDGDGPEPARLSASGAFQSIGGISARHAAAWDGHAWAALGDNLDGSGSVAAFDPDGDGPLPGDLYTTAPPEGSRFNPWPDSIARLDGTQWVEIAGGLNTYLWSPGVNAMADFDPNPGDDTPPLLLCAGNIDWHLQTWNGTEFAQTGAELCCSDFNHFEWGPWVWAATVFSPGGVAPPQVVIGGWFDSVNDKEMHGVASWDGTVWVPLPGLQSTLLALCVFDPDEDGPEPAMLLAGGSYIQGTYDQKVGLSRWDGNSWTPFEEGLSRADWPTFRALTLVDPDGPGPQPPDLYAAGEFLFTDDPSSANIARWDGARWRPLGSGLFGPGSALAPHDPDGPGPAGQKLIVGGEFTQAGGAHAAHIAQWDGAAWSAVGDGTNGPVWALRSYSAGAGRPVLYAGGEFSIAGDAPAANVAAWDGASWSALGAGTDDLVRSLFIHDDDGPGPIGPALYAGGEFHHAGGLPSDYLARWGDLDTPCPADCDNSGTLDLTDWLCFAALFHAANSAADCDQSGSLDLFDFLCFVNAFNAGC